MWGLGDELAAWEEEALELREFLTQLLSKVKSDKDGQYKICLSKIEVDAMREKAKGDGSGPCNSEEDDE